MRAIARTLLIAAAIGVLGTPQALAGLKRSDPAARAVVFRPRFKLVSSHFQEVAANRRYVFFTTETSAGESGTLIDEQTAARTTLVPPECPSFSTPMFGGPWLLLRCATAGSGIIELYDLATGQWASLPSICHIDGYEGTAGCAPIGVGSQWIRYEETCYHCKDRFVDQNIWSGELRDDPATPGGTKIADLNSPTLVRTLCKPLRVPTSDAPTPDSETEAGPLAFYGSFVLASEVHNGRETSLYLEKCGSRRRVRISANLPAGAPVGNSNMLLWRPLRGVRGVFLPTLRPLVVKLPTSITRWRYGVPELVGLSRRTLCVSTYPASGKLWAGNLR